jgi:dihydroflavonol-4-reductase
VTPDQLAQQVAKAAGIKAPGWFFPLSKMIVHPILILLNLWSRITGKPAKASLRLLELWGRYAWYDAGRARTELGWQPRPLDETLADTIRWMRDNPQALGTGGHDAQSAARGSSTRMVGE